ncbi:hypothetical protein [Trinickia symbiotica]|uniref:hypothetical protein n=1 Tax=Trinickia symbiotica TaxID=863227 RepID=UPI0011B244E6|nr:hypothetical protein [Trinickia symbiotica]
MIYVRILACLSSLTLSSINQAFSETIKLECHLGPNNIGMTHDVTLIVDTVKMTVNGPSISKSKDGNSIEKTSSVYEDSLFASETVQASSGAMSDIRLTVDRVSGRVSEDQHLINPNKNFDRTVHLEGVCQKVQQNKF